MTIFLYVAIILICTWYFVVSFFGVWLFVGWERDALGQFGDSWGWLTSIFSAFAFVGVYHNNQMQRRALKQAQAASKEQSDFLRVQQFESNFFQMMNLLQQILNDIDRIGTKERRGRDCFEYFYEDVFCYRFDGKTKLYKLETKYEFNASSLRKDLGVIFDSVYKDLQKDLSHYFRFVYNILKLISESGFDKDTQSKYARILRAQLSNYELLIIFYNCFSTHGKKLEILSADFCLFDNMPIDNLKRWYHLLLISPRAVNPDDLKIVQGRFKKLPKTPMQNQ